MKAVSNARILCFTRQTALAAAVWVAASANCCAEPNDAVIRVRSPNEKIEAELRLIPSEGDPSVPHLSIAFGGRPVLAPSSLRLDLADRSTLGDDCLIEESHVNEIRNQYQQHPGKRRDVVDHCREVVITLRERAPIPRRWQVVLRAYDDGIAFRFQFPDQDGWPEFTLDRERTTFTLPADATAFALTLNAFTTSYEKFYQKTPVAKLPSDWLLGLPLLLELPGTGWAAITEANLTDYAGMYLARSKAEGTTLISRLSPLPKEPAIAVRSRLPHVSPWRVVQVADQVGRLVESDLVLNLNAPCAVDDVSWIKTGKTTFPWWNGYFEENVPFEPGLNTATVKYYIDFCAEAGIPYHSLDGRGDTAWYGGPIVPYQGADPTRAVAGLDLPEVLQYARKKGVGLRLWMNWQAAQAHMARAFPVYREWGIEGVMIDFMDRDDQEMVNFLRELVKTAAENRLTVTLHGSSKPTGLERTFPNLLTSEGVLNLEYDKWDPSGVSPEHEVTIPFTRMLAGPLDFHQGSFRTVTREAFKPRNEAPWVIGTPCRTLASYVVFQNHLSMVADYPSAYRGHPGLPVLAKIPTTWDDTKVIAGAVGEYIVVARRSGDEWWVGAMTNGQGREISLPLDFLRAGKFQSETFRDDSSARRGLSNRIAEVVRDQTLAERLGSAGGLLIHLSPVVAGR